MSSKWMLVLLPLLAACTSQRLDAYVGKDVKEVMLERGAPVSVIDLDDGTKAYQWRFYAAQECVYTLIASPRGKQWIVTSYRKPSMLCE